MELGVWIVFFVFYGGYALVALATLLFFLRFLINPERRNWRTLSKGSRISTLIFAIAAITLIYIPSKYLWQIRFSTLPGTYQADGVWGNSSLILAADHTFIQTYHFVNEYNGKSEGDGSISGQWQDEGRSGFQRHLRFSSFIPLAEYDRGQVRRGAVYDYGLLGIGVGMEVDSGADIVFFKQR